MKEQEKQGLLVKGIWHNTDDLQSYMDKSKKWDNYMDLVKEEKRLDRRRKQIGQERAKLLGITAKYRK